MPRKKASRSKSQKPALNSKQTKKSVSSLAAAMEKDFKNLPLKLPALIRKDIDLLKVAEGKLTASLKKMQARKNQVKNKEIALSQKLKDKPSLMVKKQINAIKKSYDQINQTINDLNTRLTQSKKSGNLLSQKQAKYIALGKEIRRLDKEWESKKSLVPNTSLKNKRPTKKIKPTVENAELLNNQFDTIEPNRITSTTESSYQNLNEEGKQ